MLDLEIAYSGRVKAEAARSKTKGKPKPWEALRDRLLGLLKPGELAVTVSLDKPGPGGRVLLVLNAGGTPALFTLHPTDAAQLAGHLTHGVECCTAHLG